MKKFSQKNKEFIQLVVGHVAGVASANYGGHLKKDVSIQEASVYPHRAPSAPSYSYRRRIFVKLPGPETVYNFVPKPRSP